MHRATEQDEAVLVLGMIRIIEQQGALVEECEGGLLEGEAMLRPVRFVLRVVPLETQLVVRAIPRLYIVCMYTLVPIS